jgi:hypothetical protein
MRRIALAFLAVLCACTEAPPEAAREQRPQQAGQPLDPVVTAARIAAVRGAALTGNQAAVQQQMHALNEDFRRSMKLPDGTRPIDHEAARSAARAVPGVRSVAWIDHQNLLAMVEGPDARTYDTIDRICVALEPLGDTLAVVVNLQNAIARNGDELEILSRNCQLAPGDRALLQTKRQVDVLAPEVRAQHQAAQDRMRDAQTSKSDDDRANAAALEAIPEM